MLLTWAPKFSWMDKILMLGRLIDFLLKQKLEGFFAKGLKITESFRHGKNFHEKHIFIAVLERNFFSRQKSKYFPSPCVKGRSDYMVAK